MPKPVFLAQRRIRLGRPPTQESVTINHIPIFLRDNAGLVTDPAYVSILKQGGIRENQSIRLISPQLLDDARKVVDMAGTACAIQPEFHEFAVVLNEFVQQRRVVLVV